MFAFRCLGRSPLQLGGYTKTTHVADQTTRVVVPTVQDTCQPDCADEEARAAADCCTTPLHKSEHSLNVHGNGLIWIFEFILPAPRMIGTLLDLSGFDFVITPVIECRIMSQACGGTRVRHHWSRDSMMGRAP